MGTGTRWTFSSWVHRCRAARSSQCGELFPGVTAILETRFSNYKGPGETETRGFGDVCEARATLEATCRWFEAKAKGS